MNKRKKVVVIGGGTGTFTVLSGLRKYPVDLTALVSMADDGGSTGVLRDELGVLPPGDIRQCLVALSNSPQYLRELMNYRFNSGSLSGHAFGNLFISALEKTSRSFDEAIEKASGILDLVGRVVPVTLDKVNLVAHIKGDGVIVGEHKIENSDLSKIDYLELRPRPKVNVKAIDAIKHADIIVIGPGDIFTSILPDLIVPGISKAIKKSKSKLVYICNLMTKKGHTDNWDVLDHTSIIESMIGREVDRVIYNTKIPNAKILEKYKKQGEIQVLPAKINLKKYIGASLLSNELSKKISSDIVRRSLVRHNPDKLAKIILKS